MGHEQGVYTFVRHDAELELRVGREANGLRDLEVEDEERLLELRVERSALERSRRESSEHMSRLSSLKSDKARCLGRVCVRPGAARHPRKQNGPCVCGTGSGSFLNLAKALKEFLYDPIGGNKVCSC